ncbi:MAG: hypothetical protein MZU97_05100 [Bacillus subtilis]|nr:hypothetical protein [Bacillus subtilis]
MVLEEYEHALRTESAKILGRNRRLQTRPATPITSPLRTKRATGIAECMTNAFKDAGIRTETKSATSIAHGTSTSYNDKLRDAGHQEGVSATHAYESSTSVRRNR